MFGYIKTHQLPQWELNSFINYFQNVTVSSSHRCTSDFSPVGWNFSFSDFVSSIVIGIHWPQWLISQIPQGMPLKLLPLWLNYTIFCCVLGSFHPSGSILISHQFIKVGPLMTTEFLSYLSSSYVCLNFGVGFHPTFLTHQDAYHCSWSTEDILLTAVDYIIHSLDIGQSVCAAFLYFRKAFNYNLNNYESKWCN